MQIWTKKIEMVNLIDDDLEKSLSDESDSESDNDESNEQAKKSTLITIKSK